MGRHTQTNRRAAGSDNIGRGVSAPRLLAAPLDNALHTDRFERPARFAPDGLFVVWAEIAVIDAGLERLPP